MFKRAVVYLLAGASVALAQQTGITGRLTDPSSAALTNAIVSARSDDGVKVQTVTNSLGTYQFPTLRAGNYLLRFEAPGFAPAERTLALPVGQVAAVDVTLQLASASTSVASRTTRRRARARGARRCAPARAR